MLLTDQAAHKTLSRPPILIPQLSYKSLNHDGLRVEDDNTEHAG
jgi:hypothetical protein